VGMVRLIRETLDCYHVAVALVEGNELVLQTGVNYLYQPMPRIRLFLHEDEGVAPGSHGTDGRSWLPTSLRIAPIGRCRTCRKRGANSPYRSWCPNGRRPG